MASNNPPGLLPVYRFFKLMGLAGLVLAGGGIYWLASAPGASSAPVAAGLIAAGLMLTYGWYRAHRAYRRRPPQHDQPEARE